MLKVMFIFSRFNTQQCRNKDESLLSKIDGISLGMLVHEFIYWHTKHFDRTNQTFLPTFLITFAFLSIFSFLFQCFNFLESSCGNASHDFSSWNDDACTSSMSPHTTRYVNLHINTIYLLYPVVYFKMKQETRLVWTLTMEEKPTLWTKFFESN